MKRTLAQGLRKLTVTMNTLNDTLNESALARWLDAHDRQILWVLTALIIGAWLWLSVSVMQSLTQAFDSVLMRR